MENFFSYIITVREFVFSFFFFCFPICGLWIIFPTQAIGLSTTLYFCSLMLFVAVEFCWNVFPSTNYSSALLLCAHLVILWGLWTAAPEYPYVNEKTSTKNKRKWGADIFSVLFRFSSRNTTYVLGWPIRKGECLTGNVLYERAFFIFPFRHVNTCVVLTLERVVILALS